MAYIGNQPFTTAFLTDQFSGNGSTTAFTLSAAPANTNSLLVAITGVLQDPSTYSVAGTTLTFSAAPPSGTGNISVRFLGIPASGVVTTAYRTLTEFTATAGQTTFTPPSYTVGYINVFRNGVMLGTADYTASNGTTVVLASAASAGDLVVTESFYVSSVLNAIPGTAGSVGTTYLVDGSVTAAKLASGAARTNFGAGAVLQVVQATIGGSVISTTSTSFVSTGLSASITPASATSKVLVSVNLTAFYSTVANTSGRWTIYRGVSNIAPTGSGTGQNFGEIFASAGQTLNNSNALYLDSPATTSSTTYTIYFASNNGNNVQFQPNNQTSTMVLMEIAA